jgi:hypothetical protein
MKNGLGFLMAFLIFGTASAQTTINVNIQGQLLNFVKKTDLKISAEFVAGSKSLGCASFSSIDPKFGDYVPTRLSNEQSIDLKVTVDNKGHFKASGIFNNSKERCKWRFRLARFDAKIPNMYMYHQPIIIVDRKRQEENSIDNLRFYCKKYADGAANCATSLTNIFTSTNALFVDINDELDINLDNVIVKFLR